MIYIHTPVSSYNEKKIGIEEREMRDMMSDVIGKIRDSKKK